MKNDQKNSSTYEVDTEGLSARKCAEAELICLSAQLRDFSAIRDRLTAEKIDPGAHYNQLLHRRTALAAHLLKTAEPDPRVASHAISQARRCAGQSAAQLIAGPGVTGPIFGGATTGSVFIPPPIATEHFKVGPPPRPWPDVFWPPFLPHIDASKYGYPMEGDIEPHPGYVPNVVQFGGVLHVGPPSIPSGQYDPTIRYFWIRNWTFLIAFPPPATQSRFTYRFSAFAEKRLFFGGGEGMTDVFVSIGETNNLVSGVPVKVTRGAGWPISHDLDQRRNSYNGHFGVMWGDAPVHRSFVVGAGRSPGVAITIGVIESLSMQTELKLVFGGTSSLGISSDYAPGAIEYSYQPILVNQA